MKPENTIPVPTDPAILALPADPEVLALLRTFAVNEWGMEESAITGARAQRARTARDPRLRAWGFKMNLQLPGGESEVAACNHTPEVEPVDRHRTIIVPAGADVDAVLERPTARLGRRASDTR